MSGHPDPKQMARALRTALSERAVALTHSEALEIVARQFGCENWNILAARLTAGPASPPSSGAMPEGWVPSGRSDLFRFDVRQDAGPKGRPAILIASRASAGDARAPVTGEFLTVMQAISAEAWRNIRITFSAAIRTTKSGGCGATATGHGAASRSMSPMTRRRSISASCSGAVVVNILLRIFRSDRRRKTNCRKYVLALPSIST